MNVLVIPEDFRKDQFILKPVLKKMLAAAGKPKAKLRICIDPLLGGIGEALKWDRIKEIVGSYPWVQLFLLVVDRDGQAGRRQALDGLEQKAEGLFDAAGSAVSRRLLAENAWQEIEVWALAGADNLPQSWRWGDIRSEVHPKEVYFETFAEKRGLLDEPGQGRTTLGREAAKHYSRIRTRCKEDVVRLESQIQAWFDEKVP